MRAWVGGLAFECEPEKAFSPPILRIRAGCLHPQEKRFALEIGARSSPVFAGSSPFPTSGAGFSRSPARLAARAIRAVDQSG